MWSWQIGVPASKHQSYWGFLASTDATHIKAGHIEEGGGMKSRREINQEGRKGNVTTKNVSVSEVEQSGGCLQSWKCHIASGFRKEDECSAGCRK